MGILGSLFGKNAKPGYNKAAPWINTTFQPGGQAGAGAIDMLSKELGGGFDDYRKNAGWDFELDEGLDAITGNRAAKGLLRSGGTGKDYVKYGTDLKKRFYDNYLGQLGNLGQLGLGAGNLVAGANQVGARGESSGIIGKIGQAAGGLSSLFSDRRLKTDIEKIGEEPDGLPWYRFRYLWDAAETVREGTMADDVARLRPWALGPSVGGYSTVAYERL